MARRIILFTSIVFLIWAGFEGLEARESDEGTQVEIVTDPIGFDGIHIQREDLSLHVGGRFALDGTKYSHANARSSGMEWDTARLYLEGEWDRLRFRVEPDLIGVDTPRNLYEAWASWEFDIALRLKAGQFPVALGTEFATPEAHLPLVGYGFPAYLDGRYDTGLKAEGSLLQSLVWYEATATTGNGFGLEGHRKESPWYALRMVGRPFLQTGEDGEEFLFGLNGLFFGAGFAYSTDFDEPVVLATPFESTVFDTEDLEGDDGRWYHLEAGYSAGPLRMAWERTVGSAEDVPVGGGAKEDFNQLTAWAAYAAWNITGEEQHWNEGRWGPSHAQNEEEERRLFPGRWEAAARYANADIDRDLFVYGFTDYQRSTQEVRTFSLALNWFPTRHNRVSLGWVKTIADHELITFGDTNRDSSYVLRLEWYF